MPRLPIPFAGALALWSTTPEPSPSFLIDRILARRPSDQERTVRIVVLQTPLAEPQPEQVAMLDQQFSGHGVPVEATDAGLQSADDAADPAVIACIDAADIVLVTGGDPERMAAIVRNTPAEEALRRGVQRGGIVGGGSAGAMVWASGMAAGKASDPSGVSPLLGWLPDLVVAPHFGRYPIAGWQALFPDATILGLPDGAVVTVTSDPSGQRILTSLGEVAAEVLMPEHADAPGLTLPIGATHRLSDR